MKDGYNQKDEKSRNPSQNEKESIPAKKRVYRKKGNHEEISNEQLIQGILKGNRTMLARAITLIESNAEHHFYKGQQLLQKLLPYTGKSIRIGITGVPGAGKSTLIEAFGNYLCGLGLKVAVLAIDPSSKLSGGSILGDKTRMEQLAKNERAFIRPSPAGGTLGGVNRKTRETMLICEAFGFDVVIVETVGVGQSEVSVRDMVDFFMLIVLTGAGDELQGMKKGIMELTDVIVVNKADGENIQSASKTKKEYNQILHFLQPATKGWSSKAYTCSAIEGKGISELWDTIVHFQEITQNNGVFFERRKEQNREWLKNSIMEILKYRFFSHPNIKMQLPNVEQQVIEGHKTVSSAVEELMNYYECK